MSYSSTWPKDRTLSDAATPVQCESGSNGTEEILCIPQSSTINGASLSDCFMSHTEHWFGGGYSTTDMQSGNSTASADWAV